MSKFKDFLTICAPGYWLRNYPCSKEWDRLLNRLLDTEKFVYVDEFTAKLGGVEVWITNHPYASFRPYAPERLEALPARRTVLRARRKLLLDIPDLFNRDARTLAQKLGLEERP
jgi:hypothetical protein